MIQYKINTGNSTQLSIFYEEWDIADCDKLTDWHRVTIADKDKYIKFNDGSGWYAKIYMVSKDYIRTSAGLFRIKDIIHCSKPKYIHWGYSGASDNEESFEVRPASKNEKAKANRLLNGHQPRSMTRRVRMLVLDKLVDQSIKVGLDEEYIVSRLKDWADGNGQHAYKSLVTLARLHGIEIEKALDKQDNGGRKSIADRLGIGGTVQNDRKQLPSKREIGRIVDKTEDSVSVIKNVDGVYKDEPTINNRAEAGEDQDF